MIYFNIIVFMMNTASKNQTHVHMAVPYSSSHFVHHNFDLIRHARLVSCATRTLLLYNKLFCIMLSTNDDRKRCRLKQLIIFIYSSYIMVLCEMNTQISKIAFE